MAKKEKDLLQTLRASGLRKKVARSLTSTATSSRSNKTPKVIGDTVKMLRDAASTLESRAGASSRSEAAKKAARTRKRKASKRSLAAKKAARTRSRSR